MCTKGSTDTDRCDQKLLLRKVPVGFQMSEAKGMEVEGFYVTVNWMPVVGYCIKVDNRWQEGVLGVKLRFLRKTS